MAKLCMKIMYEIMHKNFMDINHCLGRRMRVERKRQVIIKK